MKNTKRPYERIVQDHMDAAYENFTGYKFNEDLGAQKQLLHDINVAINDCKEDKRPNSKGLTVLDRVLPSERENIRNML